MINIPEVRAIPVTLLFPELAVLLLTTNKSNNNTSNSKNTNKGRFLKETRSSFDGAPNKGQCDVMGKRSEPDYSKKTNIVLGYMSCSQTPNLSLNTPRYNPLYDPPPRSLDHSYIRRIKLRAVRDPNSPVRCSSS